MKQKSLSEMVAGKKIVGFDTTPKTVDLEKDKSDGRAVNAAAVSAKVGSKPAPIRKA